MVPKLDILPQNIQLVVEENRQLLDVLREAGMILDAPCGGNGTCGKCRLTVNGTVVSACRTVVDRDMTVVLPKTAAHPILREESSAAQLTNPFQAGYLLAFDIGTTSLVCFLLDGKTGAELAKSSMLNPQRAFGADVITRIQAALQGKLEQLTQLIRHAMTKLIEAVCDDAGIRPEEIGVVSVVGNPAMQQLFLGIAPENLSKVPFEPVLTEAEVVSCEAFLPICAKAQLMIVPDLAGYIGADTIGCLLATGFSEKDEINLLVDIGTNGELVLGNRHRMIACATAAGPALEGANIRFGMRAAEGAIDHVWLENGAVTYSVIGGGEATGICGSGLIDAIAVMLKLGLLNKRGRIQNPQRCFYLTESIFLSQDDVRQLQLAKGAVHAGICMMAAQLGIELEDIQKVRLAGAFGSYMNPDNACRIGLLPEQLRERIEVVGNAAGSGAKMLACDRTLLAAAQTLSEEIEFLELASLAQFPKTFAEAMHFREETV